MPDHIAPDASADALSADALWTEARAILSEVMKMCGDPQALADQLGMRRTEHAIKADFVRETERLVRRIVVVLAADAARTLPPPKPRAPREAPATPAQGAPAAPAQNADPEAAPVHNPYPLAGVPPEDWRVSFPILHKPPERRSYKPGARARHNAEWRKRKAELEAAGVRKPYAPPYQPNPLINSAGLARRIEALRRVTANPEPYILRTARRLQRLRAWNRVANQPITTSTSSAPPRRPHSVGWRYCGAAIRALDKPLAAALRYLDTG